MIARFDLHVQSGDDARTPVSIQRLLSPRATCLRALVVKKERTQVADLFQCAYFKFEV